MRPSGLVFTLALLLAACGSDRPNPVIEGGGREGGIGGGGGGGDGGSGGAPGGMGGSGGTGEAGSGGSAGAGGSGGAEEKLCGNGIRDEGEECDDGNRDPLDGCSPDCQIEGTCESPIPWDEVAVPSESSPNPLLELMEVQGEFLGNVGRVPVCSAEGQQLAFEIEAPADGLLVVGFQKPSEFDSAIAFVARSCDEQEEPLTCEMDGGPVLKEFPVLAGERLLFGIDAQGGDSNFPYRLAAGFISYREEGEPCDRTSLNSKYTPCKEPLFCTLDDVCKRNEAPILEEAQLFRHGPKGAHLTMHVLAADPERMAMRLNGRFLDGEGNAIGERLLTIVPLGHVSDYWYRFTQFFVDFHPELAEAVQVELWLEDIVPGKPDQSLTSNILVVSLDEIPIREAGENCDPERLQNRCAEGTFCSGEPATCEALAPFRQAVCEEALEIELGETLAFTLAAEDVLPSYWELPQSCVEGWKKQEDWYKGGHATKVLRFDATEDLQEVRIALQSPEATVRNDLGLALFPGCENENSLVCVDERSPILNDPVLTFEELEIPFLPEGTYFVVVRDNLAFPPPHPVDMTITITAD